MSPVSRSTMSGLTFPITRAQNIMMELATVTRKTDTAAVYLASVCEYLTAEVLELAGNAATESKRVRITPRHIMLAVRNDVELDRLYRDTVFAGGVLPHIDSSVLHSAKSAKAKRSSSKPKKSEENVAPKKKATAKSKKVKK